MKLSIQFSSFSIRILQIRSYSGLSNILGARICSCLVYSLSFLSLSRNLKPIPPLLARRVLRFLSWFKIDLSREAIFLYKKYLDLVNLIKPVI